MSGILIYLSSDEDDDPPTNKKLKYDLSSQYTKNKTNTSVENLNESIICLDSDDENDSEDVLFVTKETFTTDNASNNNAEDVIIISKDNSNRCSLESVNIENSKYGEISPPNLVCIDKTASIKETCTKEPSLSNKENLQNNCALMLSVESTNDNLDTINTVDSNPTVSVSLSEDSSDVNDETEVECELSNSDPSNSNLESQNNQNLQEQNDSTIRESDLMANTEDLPSLAKIYLSTCLRTFRKTPAGPIYRKYPAIIKMFKLLSGEFSEGHYLSRYLQEQIKVAEETVSGCVVSFTEVYTHLKHVINSQSIDLDIVHRKHARKMEKIMKLLMKRLKKLEEDEVDFDDEDNSPYIKHEEYSKRLNKVYKKYCEILKKNPYAGRLTYERLDFVSSRFNEINRAISREYKNNEKFPSYDELAAMIKKIVEENNIPLSETGLRLECEKCFKNLGELLQTRRKKELYEMHQKYLIYEDPAKNDKDLEKRLLVSAIKGKEKMGQICEEFVRKQELGLVGEEVDLSESDSNADEDSEAE